MISPMISTVDHWQKPRTDARTDDAWQAHHISAALTPWLGACHGLRGATPTQGQQPPVASFKSSVDHGSDHCRGQRSQGPVRSGPQRTRFRNSRRRAARKRSPIFAHDVAGRQHRDAVRRQRQHGRPDADAREAAATHVLSWLDADDATKPAIYTFDTHLDEATPFTVGLKDAARIDQTSVVPFGETSLHDAIAADGAARRRSVTDADVPWSCLTDGADYASRLKPADVVSAIASEIDVPVYIFGVVPSIDNPVGGHQADSAGRSALDRRPLPDLAALDRRSRLPGEHAGAAQHRGAADHRRAARISISSLSNRAAGRAGIRSWSARATRT